MATKWGTFSEPGFLHPGVIYNKAYKAPKDVALSGSFKPALGCTKTGKTNDATFNKFASIHAGDIFQDAQTRLASKGKIKGAKTDAGVPFKAASPMKQAPGAQTGTHYGTFGGKIPYVPNPETRHKKEDIVHPLRQITTNPMKKGSYGFNKTTLSERKGYKGVMGEYEYHANPIDWHKPSTAPAKGKKTADLGVFRPPTVGRVGSLFNKIEYVPLGPAARLTKSAKAESAAFKPPHSGSSGTLGKYEYIPCPAIKQAPSKQSDRPAWRPNFDHRTGATPSVMRTNLHAIPR
ncbi:hypothetical protein ABBQ32_011474 [Trebouxia sp. C0010 RCD-2024]